ncbi:MAG: OmpA family protein [Vibrio sp.]
MKNLNMKKSILYGLVLSLFSCHLSAATYTVPFDKVRWKATKNADNCQLYVEDAKAGLKVRFSVSGSSPLTINIGGRNAAAFKNDLSVGTVQPVWGQDRNYETTTVNEVNRNRGNITVVKGADHIYRDLLNGAWFYVGDLFHGVTIPTTNITQALDTFQTCTTTMPPVSFKKAQKTVFHFKSGQSSLSEEQKYELNNISQLVMHDPSIKRILIDGHTDNIGDDVVNLRVSKRRADEAAYWMMMEGVDENIIETRGQGERYPVSTNNTEEGRDKNRRIEIRLVRK